MVRPGTIARIAVDIEIVIKRKEIDVLTGSSN